MKAIKFLKKLFQKVDESKVGLDLEKALAKLREIHQRLEERKTDLQKKVIAEHQKSLKLVESKNKNAVIVSLRRQKLLKRQIEAVKSNQLCIECQIQVVEKYYSALQKQLQL